MSQVLFVNIFLEGVTFRLTNCHSKISDQNDTFQMPNSRWGLDNLVKFERAHMAPNSKPVVKVERCRQNLNRSLHDLLWFMNYYLATHSMYLDILTASYITEEYVRTRRKYKCTLCGRRLKKLPCRFVENDTKEHQMYHLMLNV